MKLLLTHRFFWPDAAPYGMILRIVGDELAQVGHDVRIFSTTPSYRDGIAAPASEKLGKLQVRRIRIFQREKANPLKRIANITLYCTALFVEVIKQRPDIVTAATYPPIFAAWSASLAAKLTGARFIYHIQDIHPEVSFYAGRRLGRGISGRVLKWLDNQTLRRASFIVTLSNDMADTLRARGVGDLPIRILNNPSLDSATEHAALPPPELIKPKGVRRAIFAGNLGSFQNLSLLTEGVARCFERHPDLELMFLGEGTALPELKLRWEVNPKVRVAPFLPYPQARELIAGADVGLVSLSQNIYRVAYPSKIATYLDLGLRILALVEPDSQMARELEDSGNGVVPASATPEGVAEALERILTHRAHTPVRDMNIGSSKLMWAALISEMESPR